MTKDEALKLGLQVVEAAEYLANNPAIFGEYVQKQRALKRALIQRSKIAFEEALAQPDQESDDLTAAYMSGVYDGKNKNAPQPKPEQEPVTLQINGIPPFKNPPNDVIDAAFHVSKWAQRNNWTKWRIGYCCSVDYTTPPQREWVGLTEEEVDECYYWKDRQWTTDELVRHVEAKLKEKNT